MNDAQKKICFCLHACVFLLLVVLSENILMSVKIKVVVDNIYRKPFCVSAWHEKLQQRAVQTRVVLSGFDFLTKKK